MPPIEPEVQRVVSDLNEFQQRLSLRWRENVNMRSIVILVILGALLLYAYLFLIRPPSNFPIGELVTVETGRTVGELAHELKEQQVIRSPLAFKGLILLLGSDRTVRAGDYLFKEPRDVLSVARAMAAGAFGLEPIRVRIPEGANTKEMAHVYDRLLQRFDAEKFLAKAQPQEGYLFPDTYFFLPNATEDMVIETMRQNFDTRVAAIREEIDAFGEPFEDIVILASIIEKEARNSDDRRKISSVLWNRLERDMALQVDVTFLYTIGKGTFDLTKEDLASESPYNTYINKGLPPTAIGSPSLDALLAAVQPADTDYLFFMADLSGVTHFCKTHACHTANKARYY